MNQRQAFFARIDTALHDDQLRTNFRTAMTGIMAKRAEQFPDDAQLQALREQALSNRDTARFELTLAKLRLARAIGAL